MIEAKVVLDSTTPNEKRLTTMEVNVHRFILAEMNTHRVFSRNSQSSRALPIKGMIERIRENPAMPVEWGKNIPGMQAKELLVNGEAKQAEILWLRALDSAIETADKLSQLGVHKQIVNRLLEPFMYQRIIITSTEWENFFKLRAHEDAQPEFRETAFAMLKAYRGSTPTKLSYGEWHTPYIREEEDLDLDTRKKVSVARCARVSYLTNDGIRDIDKDLELFNRLVIEEPVHSSPAEHVATPFKYWYGNHKGNLNGWTQYRHILEEQKYYATVA